MIGAGILSVVGTSVPGMDFFGYDAGDGQSVADVVVLETARMRASEARRFVAVAAFADVHAPREGECSPVPGAEGARRFGGDGTPEVMEFTSRELAPLIGRSPLAGATLLRNALDVRHRLPLLWGRIVATCGADAPGADPALAAGMVEVWQACEVAKQCHAAGLSLEQARWVDAEVTPFVGALPWSRVLDALAERVVAADPESAEARRDEELKATYVAAGQCNEHGVKTLVAKAEAGDVIALLAMLDLLAGCLTTDGVDGTRAQLRARAVGIIANPAEALALLLRHALVDQPPAPDETAEPSPADTPDVPAKPDDTTGSGQTGDRRVRSRRLGVQDLFGDRRVDPREAESFDTSAHQMPDVAGALDQDEVGDRDPGEDSAPDPDPPPEAPQDPATEPAPGGWMGHLGGAGMLSRLFDLLRQKIDPTKLRPERVLYFHLQQSAYRRDRNGVVRFEGEQPITLQHLHELLQGARVSVKPVIDLETIRAVETYAVPDDLREAIQLVSSHSLFPFSTTGSRAGSVDAEHAVSFDDDSPLPQTRLDNLASC